MPLSKEDANKLGILISESYKKLEELCIFLESQHVNDMTYRQLETSHDVLFDMRDKAEEKCVELDETMQWRKDNM